MTVPDRLQQRTKMKDNPSDRSGRKIEWKNEKSEGDGYLESWKALTIR
jgi:hypothetical protein